MEELIGPAANILGGLSLVVIGIPILIVVLRVLRAPLRTWLPLIAIISVIGGTQGCSELIGQDGIAAIMYLLAGGGTR